MMFLLIMNHGFICFYPVFLIVNLGFCNEVILQSGVEVLSSCKSSTFWLELVQKWCLAFYLVTMDFQAVDVIYTMSSLVVYPPFWMAMFPNEMNCGAGPHWPIEIGLLKLHIDQTI